MRLSRCVPCCPTYPTCAVSVLVNWCWMERFHCCAVAGRQSGLKTLIGFFTKHDNVKGSGQATTGAPKPLAMFPGDSSELWNAGGQFLVSNWLAPPPSEYDEMP